MIGFLGSNGSCASRRTRMAFTLAALCLIAAGVTLFVLVSPSDHQGESSHHNSLLFLVPIYTALIPTTLAAWRRRRNKNDV